MDLEIKNKWWFWLFSCVCFIFLLLFIISMTYALHPTELRIYANDEMVVASGNLLQTQRDNYYNDCMYNCIYLRLNETQTQDCLYSCEKHYDKNITVII